MSSQPNAWRVGSKVPLNVYEGNRPVCQCHNEVDAARIVSAFAAVEILESNLRALYREHKGEVWLWQGDGEDHPESLSCPVLISADDLRKLIAASKQHDPAT